MSHKDRIVFVTYPGAELLDLVGPSAVFSTASRLSEKKLYDIVVAAFSDGQNRHSCGIETMVTPISQLTPDDNDTILVIGADRKPLAAAMTDRNLTDFMKMAAKRAKRFGSICSGTFVLAAAGLIGGKTVATHWSACAELRKLFPDVVCDSLALYRNDGPLWTSAGVTTGIDMALAMLEADHGAPLKASVARQLVVYSHRPGHQSQFSELLVAQTHQNSQFLSLIDWLSEQTAKAVSIEQMADFMGMSPRTFHRKFVTIFNQTPGKLYENLRLDAARGLIEAGAQIASVVAQTGFQSESAFRTAFKLNYGVTPSLYRQTWLAGGK